MSSSRDVVLPNKTYFYFAFTLVVATMFLVQLYYHDAREHREKFRIRPLEIFLLLWRIREYPTVLRISIEMDPQTWTVP